MMRVDQQPMPNGFVDKICKPGQKWLRDNPGAKSLKSLWLDPLFPGKESVKTILWRSYHRICSYTLFRLRASYNVEHYLPKGNSSSRELAYCWYNYRLSDSYLNMRKHTSKAPDPFRVPIDACEINFGDQARIVVSPNVANAAELDNAINNVLHLNEGAYPLDRFTAYERYLSKDPQNKIGIVELTECAPYVAYEMLRQNFIETSDRAKCITKLSELGFSWVKARIPR